MKSKLLFLLVICIALTTNAAEPDDPCALVPAADAAKIIGEIKETKTTEGLRKEKQCDYTTASGAWLKVSLQTADAWEMQKMMFNANDPTPIFGLGEEAFQVKRGNDRVICVRKGKHTLEVSSTVGLEQTQKFAQAAVKNLP